MLAWASQLTLSLTSSSSLSVCLMADNEEGIFAEMTLSLSLSLSHTHTHTHTHTQAGLAALQNTRPDINL